MTRKPVTRLGLRPLLTPALDCHHKPLIVQQGDGFIVAPLGDAELLVQLGLAGDRGRRGRSCRR